MAQGARLPPRDGTSWSSATAGARALVRQREEANRGGALLLARSSWTPAPAPPIKVGRNGGGGTVQGWKEADGSRSRREREREAGRGREMGWEEGVVGVGKWGEEGA
jgi:hypothetical protein